MSHTPLETLYKLRRIILKHKVREFTIKEIREQFSQNSFGARALYWATVNGCNSATIAQLVKYDYFLMKTWAEGRGIYEEITRL
jgi:hypothetical protein